MEDTEKRGPGRPRKNQLPDDVAEQSVKSAPMHKVRLLRDYWLPERVKAGASIEVSAEEAMRLIEAGVAVTKNA